VALTAETAVPGCGTGSSQIVDIEAALRFVLEVAKDFGEGKAAFYDEGEFARLIALYGTMNQLQTLGKQ
jgi:hypothetical protein